MTTNVLKEHKKRLAARKTKINALVTDLEEHEHAREESAKNRTTFTDPKYASAAPPPSYAYTRGRYSDDEDQSKSSAGNEARRLQDSEPGPKKKGKKKKGAGTQQQKSAPPTVAKRKSSVALTSRDKVESTPKGSKKGLLLKPSLLSHKAKEASKDAEKPDDDKHSDDGDTKIEIENDESDEDDEEEEEEDDEEEGFHHIIEALHCFENTKYIFMQRLLDFSETEAIRANLRKKGKVQLAYQILNVEGQLLFLMQQRKVRCTGFIVYSKKSFEHTLYDIYGNKVLKYIGPSVFMSRMTSKMTITDSHDRILGYVKSFGTKVNYSVYNAIGERLFLVVSNLYIPADSTDFTILCRGEKIGMIKYGWKHTFHDLNFIDYETSGIEFPSEMDEREKALLLGCLMLIEFFWYSPLTRLKLSLLFAGIFLVTLAIVILCIPLIVDSPGDDEKTKSYYIAEKLDAPKKVDNSSKTTTTAKPG